MYLKKIFLALVALTLLHTELIAIHLHPFYLSVTEIEYFPRDKRIGISIKLFSDDLENTINEKRKTRIDITNGNKVQNNTILKAYIQEHFSIDINNQHKIPSYLGYELERDAIWIYLEINAQSIPPSTIEVNTDILYDQHEEQINIIHSIVKGKRISKKLTFPEHKCQFKY